MSSQNVKFKVIQSNKNSILPLIVEPRSETVELLPWAEENRSFINERLTIHGAILFRGFSDSNVENFGKFSEITSKEVIHYTERSSPRHTIKDKIYTSTDYPPDQKIFPHNEHSYSKTFPLKLYFFCSTPAQAGGETPIADCRKIIKKLKPETLEKFRKKQWMYVRNFGDGFGLPWETVFQTNDRSEVENYCRKNEIGFEWKEGNQLRTRQVRPAIIKHPVSNEDVWFNHLTFFNITTLEKNMQNVLLEAFGEENLPNNTYYGDGSIIEDAVLEELRAAYQSELISFKWKQNDIILIDNVSTAHSRNSFTPPREILFSMAEPFTRTDL